MKTKITDWLKENFGSLRSICVTLSVLTPPALVIGRAAGDIFISIAAILFLFDAIKHRRWDWTRQAWIVVALALWAYSVARAAFIPHGAVDLFKAFVWLRYIIFAACVAQWVIPDERARIRLIYTSAATVAFLSIDGIIQYIFGRDIIGRPLFTHTRLTAIYERPILGVTIANLFAPPVFWLLQRKKSLLSALLAGVCFAAIFLSGDRMGLLFAAFIAAVWLFCLMRVHGKRWQILAAAACMFAILLVAAPRLFHRQIQSTATTAEHIASSPYGLVWKS
ncbi:MAG: hypothetical protein KGI97_07270, partial [Alphaproteobacteria bacterium]|nr:hypothetical protein [Alphaproteobacteria bacterium]